ncbi:protection of telomeres protein 1a-like [Iris pallida]|uniref:Protection of telomeres protein 1a-like n=1 Tax=Iris pallida TaxID=29817 RepID=A0AAX6FPH2_IRIPA|nr:protection of telomeres protein 1a-like [Iris pallida]
MSTQHSSHTIISINKARDLFLENGPMKVSLFCKITAISFSFHANNGGTDYCRVLKLIDNSCPDSPLTMVFFAAEARDLPNVRSVGDIICLFDAQMKDSDRQMFCFFKKRHTTYSLFSGDGNGTFDPYATNTNVNVPTRANERIPKLRSLSIGYPFASGLTENLRMINSIATGKTFDLVCKVFHMNEISNDVMMLYVWDGTDAPPAAFHSDLDMEKDQPSPLYLDVLPLGREVICTFPREGTILRINIPKPSEDMNRFQSGPFWVKFSKITYDLQSGLWRGLMNDTKSRIFLLSEEDYNVQVCQRVYEERKHRSSPKNRMPSAYFRGPTIVTAFDDKRVGYATLMDSLTNLEVTHEFKTVVRVVTSFPWRSEDLRSPKGTYRIRLTLEDHTTRVHAYIFGKNGEKFFGHNLTTNELTKKMNKLLGIEDDGTMTGSRNPPWMHCYLRSFYMHRNDRFGSRNYWIINTRLIVD